MQKRVDVERHGQTVIVTLKERLDILAASELMQTFTSLLEVGATEFIVDLTAVRVVTPDADYPLLHLLKGTQAVDGSVILVCPSDNPIRIFYEMMRLDTLFEMTVTLDEALQQLVHPLEI